MASEGPSIAGRTTSITTSVLMLKARTSLRVVRYCTLIFLQTQFFYLLGSLTIDSSFTWHTGLYVLALGAHDGTSNGVLNFLSSPPIYTC